MSTESPDKTKTKLSRLELANAIRVLAMDAVQKANSGHPGMPMGMADIAEVLWNDFLKHNPKNPHWVNRDRFILSNGHGSMLQYALLHLSGYELTIEDLKHFRQLHSKTPGHPEFGITPGVETTTGPLGQGFANAVGMAIAETMMAARFNQPNFPLINHYTYVFVGDGCLMEGISHEAASLAGHLKLHKLIAFYDANQISIDGDISGWYSENVAKRFQAYGWQVIDHVDGHNAEAIYRAIEEAKNLALAPALIICRTKIGYGAPNLAGSEKSHGSPLGEEEIKLTRENLNWKHKPFEIPKEIYHAFDARKLGKQLEDEWLNLFENYCEKYPVLATEFRRRTKNELPENWQAVCQKMLEKAAKQDKPLATRRTSQICLDLICESLPELVGGSADLTGSNNTWAECSVTYSPKTHKGNYIYYGVREFGMFAIMNGLALYHGFIPYGGTFLTFIDYGRNALRLAALMKQRVIYVLTHDSIGLGEDGPTHQPIEHAAILRLTPNVNVWRPADLLETAYAWKSAIENKHRPTCLLLSRQNLPALTYENSTQSIDRGAYILRNCQGVPEIIIIATGSEVSIALEAYEKIAKDYRVRLVSMPSTSVFDEQHEDYRNFVLPPQVVKRIAVEAAAKDYWYKYVGLEGKIIGLNTYGESAPAKAIYTALQITPEAIIKAVKELI